MSLKAHIPSQSGYWTVPSLQKYSLTLPLTDQILPLTLAPGIHSSIFVPIVYKLVILKIHNSEEMFRQYLVSKQQFTLILLFLD